MRIILVCIICTFIVTCFVSCGIRPILKKKKDELVIAFGSCSKQNKKQLWLEVIENNPDIWIWLGDIIYPKENSLKSIRESYFHQKNNKGYQNLKSNTLILGSWDDHDYGKNDGGKEFEGKLQSKKYLMNFLDIKKNSPRRKRLGIYDSQSIIVNDKLIRIIILDHRYFRTKLKKSNSKTHRYERNMYGDGTMLGNIQWKWLEKELTNNSAYYNIFISGIQFLNNHMGFESWATMPHERDKMLELLIKKRTNRVLFLTGDRHFSEVSRVKLPYMSHYIYDITSSGLTHYYRPKEHNYYRISPIISQKSFAVLKFVKNSILLEFRGENNILHYREKIIF